jgi:RNA polymerase sigma factor (sigma-70 family)
MRLLKRNLKTRDDADIVRSVLQGARNDYAELVRRHQDALYRHARGMGLDHDAAVDIVQDSFVKAFAHLSDCKEPAHFKAWVFRITRNYCLDYLKNVRRLTVPLSEVENVAANAETAADIDRRATLREALESLPPAMREAFLLKFDADYTYDEVAELTDASPSAVKMRVHRAREALREFLIQSGVYAA